MKLVLLSADENVKAEWLAWPERKCQILTDIGSADELRKIDQLGILCLGPDLLEQQGVRGLGSLLKQLVETDWRVVVLSKNAEEPEIIALYSLGVDDVVPWVPGSAHNLSTLNCILQRPFKRKHLMDHSEAEILKHSGIVFWIFDPLTWAFIFISSSIGRVLGYGPENWYHKNFTFKLIHPDDRERVEAFFRKIITQPGIHEVRNRMLASGGRVVWIKTLINVEVVSARDDSPKMTGILFDVTEEQRLIKDSLQWLDRQRNELEQHLDQVPLAVIKTNTNLELTTWSAGAEKLIGYRAEEVLGRPWQALALIHPEDEPHVIEELQQLMNGQVSHHELHYRNIRKDGDVVQMNWVHSCIHNQNGSLLSMLSLGREVV